MTKVFDASRPGEVERWLKKGFGKAAERAMLGTAARLVAYITTEVIPAQKPQPVDRGMYRAGWRFKRVKGGAEVFNSTPQAPIIEWGARAANIKIGRAMINALTAWVKRKGIVKGRGKDADTEARGMAFAIANSMKRKGIFNRNGKNGLRILEKATRKVPKFLDEEFKREVARELKGGG
jgi:hypothetical protein